MDELDSLKLRYRCSECKNLESHRNADKKRKCEKCGKDLTEITEKDYQHYKNKNKKKDEDKKYKKNKNKKKDDEVSSDEENKKRKRKLKRSSSTKNIEDRNYKSKKESKEEGDLTSRTNRSSDKNGKKNKRNRYRSIEKLGPILNKIVKKSLKGGKGIEKDLKKLNKIDFSDISNQNNNNITINHSNDQPTEIFVNDKEITHLVDTDVFDPLFKTLNSVFLNNFNQNFTSSNTTNYYETVHSTVRNNEQYATQHGSKPIKDESLSKLKQFKLSNKYCKKGKDGNYELPSCCICLSEIKKGKETILLDCGHMFHSKCCVNWLKKNNTCPMCRHEIE